MIARLYVLLVEKVRRWYLAEIATQNGKTNRPNVTQTSKYCRHCVQLFLSASTVTMPNTRTNKGAPMDLVKKSSVASTPVDAALLYVGRLVNESMNNTSDNNSNENKMSGVRSAKA